MLRHSDWGEADRLITLYTREQGKLRANAKGARRMRSRKAGHLEPFTRVALQLAHGRDMWIITQAETVEAYLPLRDDLVRTGYAAYVLELLDRFTYEEGENRALYQLVIQTLPLIAAETDVVPAVRYYEVRLLDLLGFRPQLFECVRCGKEIQAQDQFFSMEQGGVVCPECSALNGELRAVSMSVLKYLRHLQRSNFPAVQRAGIPAAIRPELEALLQSYLTYLLERGLNSPAFLRAVQKKP